MVTDIVKKLSNLKYTIVISEKYSSAKKIAMFLGENGFQEITFKKGKFFFAKNINNDNYLIFFSNGHLYDLDSKSFNQTFPIFDPRWYPNQKNIRSIKIINLIKLFSKKAEQFIHACDYDQEGELIGYNVLHYACGGKYENSLRAKYSSLTKQEITTSFYHTNLLKPNKNLAESGGVRHLADFIYGINLSKIIHSYFNNDRKNNERTIVSIGRVQTPTLSFVVKKEFAISNHIPDPYWKIILQLQKDKSLTINATYEIEKLNKKEASKILKECRNKKGIIERIEKRENFKKVYPFNLRELQTEGFRIFGYGPKETLDICEKLYLSGLISYPRTQSQKYPSDLDFKTILIDLKKSNIIDPSVIEKILNKNVFVVTKGRKQDAAHPAIYPTGNVLPIPNLEKKSLQIFELIVKRFIATISEPMIIHDFKIFVMVNKHMFKSNIKSTINPGWGSIYPFITYENKIPNLKEGDELLNIHSKKIEKLTAPPLRFCPTTLLTKMESEKIGTKSTRAGIIDLLIKRNYIMLTNDGSLKPTGLGIFIFSLMRKYVPKMISVNMTREMEKQLLELELGKTNGNILTEKIKKEVNESILVLFKKRDKIINEIKQNHYYASKNPEPDEIKKLIVYKK